MVVLVRLVITIFALHETDELTTSANKLMNHGTMTTMSIPNKFKLRKESHSYTILQSYFTIQIGIASHG